jgi:hypothetical protein
MNTKSAGATNPPNSAKVRHGDDTLWVPLDPETDRGEHGLTPLLLHRLGHKVQGKQCTFAQMVTQELIDLALGGHFPSLEEILIRIDGDAKTSQPAATPSDAAFEVDELMAQRFFGAINDKREGPQDDY